MDPNENLAKQRELQKWLNEYDEPFDRDDDEEYVEKLVDLAILVEAMDEWLSKGGFLPDAWKGK